MNAFFEEDEFEDDFENEFEDEKSYEEGDVEIGDWDFIDDISDYELISDKDWS
jgi:hypothetical protein